MTDTKSNLSIFDRNVIHAFGAFGDEAAEAAEIVYLRQLDRHGAQRAEHIALRCAQVTDLLSRVVHTEMVRRCEELHVPGASAIAKDLLNYLCVRIEHIGVSEGDVSERYEK